MGLALISLKKNEARTKKHSLLSNLKHPLNFSETSSLTYAVSTNVEEKALIDERNALTERLNAIGLLIPPATKKAESATSDLCMSIGSAFGWSSSEYVMAGGKSRDETNAKKQAKRLEKQKAEMAAAKKADAAAKGNEPK